MRLSLDPRRGDSQLVGGRGRREAVTVALAPERDPVVAASETVTLVLGEDAPLPESAADVEDLVRLLRGHVAQLGARTTPGSPALLRAQRLCSERIPEGYMPSRVYLVQLAEATRELVAHVERVGPPGDAPRAQAALVEAADQRAARGGLRCGPRLRGLGRFGAADMTGTGAVVIGLILVPMAWLVLRGERAADQAAAGEEPPPSTVPSSPPR